MQIPSVVSNCGGILADASSSYGSGGRVWRHVRWSIDAKPSFYYCCNPVGLSELQSLFTNGGNDTNLIWYIPRKMLTAGVDYSITLSLKNFWGQSTTKTFVTTVSMTGNVIETLILGPTGITFNRHNELYLLSQTTISSCATFQASSVVYQWKVYENYMFQPGLVSVCGTF